MVEESHASRRGLRLTDQQVVPAAVVLIAAQLALRGWALLGSWFYTDDYKLLNEARALKGPSGVLHYLNSPFDSQYMPVGRAMVWAASAPTGVDWTRVAVMTLVVQLLASVACFYMLQTLFGRRPAIVALLALYLSLSLTMPAMMWWAAALNQLPLQLVLFLSVAGWVQYLRTRRLRWLALGFGAVVVGLLCYIKALLLIPLLVWLMFAWFGDGLSVRRLGAGVRRRIVPFSLLGVLGVGAAVAYKVLAPNVFATPNWSLAGQLARTMIGRTLSTGLLGGPWRWEDANPPVALADPPGWTAPAACVVLVAMAVLVALRRRRTGRAWVLLAGWVLVDYGLLLTSRAPVVGAIIGQEPRYLTDAIPVAVLCLGLAVLPVDGAPGSSAVREAPVLRFRLPALVPVALTVVVCLGGVLSSVRYVGYWHHDNPGKAWTSSVVTGLEGQGPVDLVDAPVPKSVVPVFSYPANTTRVLVPLLVDNVGFPTVSDDLVALDRFGNPHHVKLDVAVKSIPGPKDGCGYHVLGNSTGQATTIPLDGTAFDFTWWIRIDYLSSAANTLTVTAGTAVVQAPVPRGLGSLFVQVKAAVPSVTLGGLTTGTSMCVRRVQVGNATAGGSPL